MYDISVVVPVYNAASFIKRCLESILNQTVSSLELICVNDGSKDDSLEVLTHYQKEHESEEGRRIIIVNQENGGPSMARNTGIKYATGKYLAFVDSDDCIEQEMYQSLITVAEQNKLAVVICNMKNVYPDGNIVESDVSISKDTVIDREEILQIICPTLMREDIFGGPCNRIYRTSFIQENKVMMPKNIGYGEDAVFQMQVFDKLDKTWFDSRSFYHYIHRENSQTTPKPAMFKSTFEPLFKIRCEYGKKWKIPEPVYCNHFVYCSIMDIVNTLKSKYPNKRQYISEIINSTSLRYAFSKATVKQSDYTVKIYLLYRVLKAIF